MNPPKSLMALGAAIILAAPCVARADDAAGEWQALKTRPTYFVHLKDDGGSFAKMKKESFRGPLALWINEKKKDGTIVKVEAGASLNCAYNKAHKWSCWIDVNAKNGGRYQIAGVDIGAQVKPPAAAPPIDQKPEGVSPEVWAAVVRSPKVKPENWARAARDVEAALQQSPKAAKMRAAAQPAMERLVASVEAGIEAKSDDSKIIHEAVDLGEKLAGASAPNGPGAPEAHGAPVQGKQTADGAAGEENVINALTDELKKPEVQGDMAKRLVAFLTKPDDGSVYVDAKGHEAAAAAQLEKGITEGVTKLNSTQQDRGRAAVLYFLLGEPGQQKWLGDVPSLRLMHETLQARGFFKEAMKRWTAAGAQTPGQADAGPYKGDANWPAQFLKDALDKADQVMHDPRVNAEISDSIAKHAQQIDVPSDVAVGQGPVMPGDNDLRNLMARSFDANDMYRNGAYVRDVLIPGSKPPKYRTISMKIYSQQTQWGPPPVVEERLGIFDITDISKDGGRTPSNIFGQYFPLNQHGESTFLLDDRDPKSIRYKLSMGGGKISFVPVNKDGKTPVGDPMEPGIDDLYSARKAELADPHQSYMAKLNGQNFRVIPQGGPRGQLVYFAADQNGNAIGDSPLLTTELSQVSDTTGKTSVMRDDRPLGFIGKAANGKDDQFWWLHWNDKLQAFEAIAKDKPPTDPWDPMPKPKKADGKAPDGKTPAGGVGSSTTTTGGGTAASGDDANTDRPDAKVTGGDPWACDHTGKLPLGNGGVAEQYRFHETGGGEKWRLYTVGTGDHGQNNQTYMCAYGKDLFFFNGLVPKKIPRLPYHNDQPIQIIGSAADGTLDVFIIRNGAAADGTKLLKPADASNLTVELGGGLAYGDNVQGSLDQAEEYLIPLKGLAAKLNQSGNVAAGAHVASIMFMPDLYQPNRNPVMTVYLRSGDDVKKVLTKAVETYGGENTVCKKGDAVAPALLSYFDGVANDPKLKEAFDSFKATSADAAQPSVQISCLAQQTGQPWELAKTSWGLSKGTLMVDGNGKIVASADGK